MKYLVGKGFVGVEVGFFGHDSKVARWQSCRSGDNRFGIEIFASEYFVDEINRTGNRPRCQIESIADAMTGEKCRIANYCCLKILVGVF